MKQNQKSGADSKASEQELLINYEAEAESDVLIQHDRIVLRWNLH